jgi:hypothetical protein
MDPILLLFRLAHIVLAAIWVGMAVFAAFFLAPALGDVGPDGGKVMAALQRRGMMTFLPIVAIVTLISGIWLYWKASLGFSPEYSRSGPGIGYAIGAVASLVAYGLGIGLVRPAMTRTIGLAQSAAQATSDAERSQLQAEIGRLRARGATVSRWVGLLLIVATGAMAIARYL